MTATVSKMGPGQLTIGDFGSEIDISCQVISASVSADASADDSTEVLCGDTVAGDVSYAPSLEVTMLADIADASGLVHTSWNNSGSVVDFSFTPAAGTLTVTGKIRLDPIPFGGDVGKRVESSITFAGVGPFTVDASTWTPV